MAVTRRMRRLATTRSCRGCDACCTAASVDQIGKPPGQRCAHLTALKPAGLNCLIYPRRPSDCAAFMCLWRGSDTVLGDEHFPARSGYCLWINNPFGWPMVVTVGVDPARPDAWTQPAARALFAKLAFDLNCLVAIGQGQLASHVFTPLGAVYARADHPRFFSDDGFVGAPDFDFRPGVKLTLEEIAERILGYEAT